MYTAFTSHAFIEFESQGKKSPINVTDVLSRLLPKMSLMRPSSREQREIEDLSIRRPLALAKIMATDPVVASNAPVQQPAQEIVYAHERVAMGINEALSLGLPLYLHAGNLVVGSTIEPVLIANIV